jgi:hypothetical protein
MTTTITLVLALLAATVVCATLATHLRVPYAIVLVLSGCNGYLEYPFEEMTISSFPASLSLPNGTR